MKKLILTVALGGACVSAFAQGTLDFANSGTSPPFMARVYDTDGTTGLAGSAYEADLYWAAGLVADSTQLVPLGAPATFSISQPGFFFGGARTITSVGGGSVITAQIRVWDVAHGSSWDVAAGTAGARVGESILFSVTLATPPAPPGSLSGMNSFHLTVVGPGSAQPLSFVVSLTPPAGAMNADPNTAVGAVLQDGTNSSAQVNVSNVLLSLDGTFVSPTVTKAGNQTSVRYQPPLPFTIPSIHSASIQWSDFNFNFYTNNWIFGVGSNAAPYFCSNTAALDPELENAGNPVGSVGTSVSNLVVLNSNVKDPDFGAVTGIAVINSDTNNGVWYYSTNDGQNWPNLVNPSSVSALLLAADGVTRVYFRPNANYNGTDAAALTIRAWDQSSGVNGQTADTTFNGGGSPFSTNTASVSLTVLAVNQPPVRTGGVVTNLTVLENSGLTSLGLGAVTYSPGPPNESGQTLTNIVMMVPPPSLGEVVLADGTTVVVSNTVYTLTQIQGMQFRTATNANGGPVVFSYRVQDNGGTANGGMDTLVESLQISVVPILILAPPVSYCQDYPSDGVPYVLFTVLASGDELHYQWLVDSNPVPFLDHRALRLPLPGFPLPPGPTNVDVKVIISNTNGTTNATATVFLHPTNPGPSTNITLIVVPNGGATDLPAAAGNYNNLEWRFNGIPLSNRTNIVSGTTTTNLQLTNIWISPTQDPSEATNSQVGIYELIAGSTNGCTRITRFDVQISSEITETNSVPHSVDNVEDLEAVRTYLAKSGLSAPVVTGMTGPHPKYATVANSIGILTVPRSATHSQYLDTFASSHEEHEASLFHALRRTNGFSQWFLLSPSTNGNGNQLVTLDVHGSEDANDTVIAVYARSNTSQAISITNLTPIVRFDAFTGGTNPPPGGTNAGLVSFETKQKPEFLIAVDTSSLTSTGKIRLDWNSDPFPADDRFQWLKVVLPERNGSLDVTVANPATNDVYFAFASTNNTYTNLVRLDADWAGWSKSNLVSFTCSDIAEVYLLTDPLPGSPYQVSCTTNPTTLTEAGLTFNFRTNTFPAPAHLQIVQEGGNIFILWDGDGQLVAAPSLIGPWRAIPLPAGTNHPFRVPAGSPGCFYRLSPSTGPP